MNWHRNAIRSLKKMHSHEWSRVNSVRFVYLFIFVNHLRLVWVPHKSQTKTEWTFTNLCNSSLDHTNTPSVSCLDTTKSSFDYLSHSCSVFLHLPFLLNKNVFDHQDFCRWLDEPFEEMDSTLAVQQYIQQLIKKDPSNIEAILTMPESQDEGVWKYEHLRYSKTLNKNAGPCDPNCKMFSLQF